MKILFDTNVYVSEALVGGLAERIIESTLQGRWRIYISAYILGEPQRVLAEKFGFTGCLADLTSQRIGRRSELLAVPESRHHVIADAKDSPVLRAAVVAGVDYLVSDDRDLLNLHPYEGIEIVSRKGFAAILRNEGLLREAGTS